jgi:DNA-binding GntR family transcriptional regulator
MSRAVFSQTDAEQPAGEEMDDGLPLYLQVASTLRTAIIRGIYPVGSRIPTEDELCQHFKVSRHTVREALRQLRSDGLITSRPGSRPIVAPPSLVDDPPLFAGEVGEDFFDYMIGTRLVIETMEMVPITRNLATEFGLSAGEQWLSVQGYRTHVDQGHVTCWNEYLINAKFGTVGRLLTRHVGPILPLLEDLYGERIMRITRSMSAVPMPANQAAVFRTEAGSPALSILTRCETADGKTAMLNRSIHPSGVISYSIRRIGANSGRHS